MIKLIAIVDSDWGISKNGKVPWSFSEDRKLFRKKTINGVVVMGKNTFFSLPQPLEGRINCVVSESLECVDGVKIFRSLEKTIAEYDDLWIIGGAKLYDHALKNDLVDYALITQVQKNRAADKFIDASYFNKFSRRVLFKNEKYSIAKYERA
ncbi:MAG: dihydrofolate reductase [Holosporaceae bacterium]|jgi:dihydrofolate reductase|nr:dihydrofolate reductase [Holosporaceae bacterium]